jgi:hypothetical protein
VLSYMNFSLLLPGIYGLPRIASEALAPVPKLENNDDREKSR